jgi:hypothetical protein
MPWSGCWIWELTLEDPVPPIQTPIWANIGSDWCDAKMDSWNTPWCLPVRCATKHNGVPKGDEGTRDWRSCGSKRTFRNFHSVQHGGSLGNNGPDGVQYRSAARVALNGGSRNWNHLCPAPTCRPLRKLPEGMLDLRPSVSQKSGISKPFILASRPTLTT